MAQVEEQTTPLLVKPDILLLLLFLPLYDFKSHRRFDLIVI